MSSTNGTREADADTPGTTTTRPLYVGTGDDTDEPWSAGVDAHNAEPPDFTVERRWTSVLLGALGIVVLAGLVIAVITVSHLSSEPSAHTPAPTRPSTSEVAYSVIPAPSPSPSPSPTSPPAYSSVTATASTVVAPPPVIQRGEPQPKPRVRQRLHDLFPRLFPGS